MTGAQLGTLDTTETSPSHSQLTLNVFEGLVSQRVFEIRAACETAFADARHRLADDPGLVSPTWCVYVVEAHTVEFWQGDTDRMHTRVQYRRNPPAGTAHCSGPNATSRF
ncbi:pyridoxine 5'-phosphate oxidase C-terminal domain-containing protein [Mycolicibacterium helvum]|uniref:Pyridoxine 5'-phosphate oxidase dimerisation C-terminal domain-containing protein n=1 Tax=Mycolicibacterium helvum TaxID=1534349 RepID=A0A7I7T531_9MYCO|nr:hypothetical protein MHEL_21660 [Mycolicibacterium helvum]